MARKIGWRISALIVFAVLMASSGAILYLRHAKATSTVGLERPSQDDLQSFANTTIVFGHQSVGANILDGVAHLYAGSEDVEPRIIEASGVRSPKPFLAQSFVGVNGDPESKFIAFSALMEGQLGNDAEVGLVKLCFTDITSSSDVDRVFEDYANTMNRLEREHRTVRFIFTTVPLTTDRTVKTTAKLWLGIDDHRGPADNAARERYNRLVRDKFASSGRLFDIAAIESTLAQDPASRRFHGQTYYVLNQALGSDTGHLNEYGSEVVAAEFIRVVLQARRSR